MRTYEVRFTHSFDESDQPTVLATGNYNEAQIEMERLELLWSTWATEDNRFRTFQRWNLGKEIVYRQVKEDLSNGWTLTAWIVAIEN